MTAAGTLILPSISSNWSSPIDSKKIQGGCSGFSWQEFRELELLDDITTQQYHGLMPITIMGDTRYTLIESFHHHVSHEYMPPRLDSVLAWSNVDTLNSADASDFTWMKKLITHFPILKRPLPEHPPIQGIKLSGQTVEESVHTHEAGREEEGKDIRYVQCQTGGHSKVCK